MYNKVKCLPKVGQSPTNGNPHCHTSTRSPLYSRAVLSSFQPPGLFGNWYDVADYVLTSDDLTQIRRQNTFFRDSTRRLAEWGEIIEQVAARLELLEIAVRESSEDEANAIRDLRAQVKRLEELELLRQSGREDSKEARRLRSQIKDEHSIDHLQEMLVTVTKNLQRAQLREAKAAGGASLELLNQIDELKAAKDEIESQLAELKKKRKR